MGGIVQWTLSESKDSYRKLFSWAFCWLEDSLAACMGGSLGKVGFFILEGKSENTCVVNIETQ